MTRKKRPLGGSTVSWQRETSIVVEKFTPGAARLIGYFVPTLRGVSKSNRTPVGETSRTCRAFSQRIFSSYCSGLSFLEPLPDAGSVFLSASVVGELSLLRFRPGFHDRSPTRGASTGPP